MRIGLVAEVAQCPHRIPEWALELANLGHDVVVITPKYSNSQISFFNLNRLTNKVEWIQTKKFSSNYKKFSGTSFTLNRIFQKLLKLRNRGLNSLDYYSKWSAQLSNALFVAHSLKKFDFLIVSVSPFSIIKIVSEFAQTNSIKWIVDYRDLWSQNHTNKVMNPKIIDEERVLLKNCSAVITVSKELQDRLFNIYQGKNEIIANGFRNLVKYESRTLRKPLRIIYTGSIYAEFQNFNLVIEALKDFNRDFHRANLYVYGPSSNFVKNKLFSKETKIPNWLFLENEINKSDSEEIQKSADLLLVLNWENPSSYGILGTKIFEYFGSGRPILLTGGYRNNELVAITENSGMGLWAKTREEILEFLFKFDKGMVNFHQNTQYIERYKFSSLVRKLNENILSNDFFV